ncbi:glycosyltransferase family 2 protein [Olivibacter sp. XZL3]|uniref:glycosyltransferase family 2 protein n=1 Tax=Olivibacter sp. XZL3 TaxID=1735116 RepID=UPI001064FEA8|nr:glycosyltransferase family 2 protein [Olivibacter sp. XZL3]
MRITVSIVLYHNDLSEVGDALRSCLSSTLVERVYLIDNSSNDTLRCLAKDERVRYLHYPENLGFGAAHNRAIQSCSDSDYHVMVNPDIAFPEGVLEALATFMDQHPDVGSVMPKVFYKDGKLQRLCKLLPGPFNLFGRRFASNWAWARKLNEQYELAFFDYSQIADIPCLSGCFMFTRNNILQQLNGFDTRFFLYLEDVDLIRRIGRLARTVYYPHVSITHGYQKESYHNRKILRLHMKSAIQYFNKWGWFFDRDREKINQNTLKKLMRKN